MHGDSYDSAPVQHEDISEYVTAALEGNEIARYPLELHLAMLDCPESESV